MAAKKTAKKTTKKAAKKATKKKPAKAPPKGANPIAEGRKAPAFSLADQEGTVHKLSDLAGHPVVLFFYPKDMTSGCTVEACQFRDAMPRFKRSKARVFGVSILGTKSKARFADKEGLNYPLLADDRENSAGKPDPVVAQKYGVWVEKSMYGKKYNGIRRTTYLIDADGKVARRWDDVEIDGHAEDVLAAVRELG